MAWIAVAYRRLMLSPPDWVANVSSRWRMHHTLHFRLVFIIIVTRVLGRGNASESNCRRLPRGRPVRADVHDSYTAPFLLLYAAFLAAGRMRHGALHRRSLFLITGEWSSESHSDGIELGND